MGKRRTWQSSNDKPTFDYGLPMMDDYSVSRLIDTVASMVPRHYIVMEVQKNLLSVERSKTAKRFNARHFKRIAHVVMGEPSQSHKDMVKKKILEKKQFKLDNAYKAKLAEKEKRRLRKERDKEILERRKK